MMFRKSSQVSGTVRLQICKDLLVVVDELAVQVIRNSVDSPSKLWTQAARLEEVVELRVLFQKWLEVVHPACLNKGSILPDVHVANTSGAFVAMRV